MADEDKQKQENIVEQNIPQDVIKIIEKKRQKPEVKPIIIYMNVEEPEISWKETVERAIINAVRQWVETYKMPIRRKKLVELVCMDENVKKRCNEKREQTLRSIEFIIKEMHEKRLLVKIIDPNKKLAVWYALPEHIKLLKEMAGKKAG